MRVREKEKGAACFFGDGNCMPISRDNYYECSQVKTVSLRIPPIDSLSKRLSYHSSISFPFASTVLFPDNEINYLFRWPTRY